MMLFYYTTEHLVLQILGEEAAPLVLEFLNTNREAFEPWDCAHSSNFYSLEYQRKSLLAETKLLLAMKGIRFYIFEKVNPDQIIGTVSLANMNTSSCSLGYRIAHSHQRKGYGYEAVQFLLPHIMDEFRIYRIEADILPQNMPSIHLAERLGFQYEGIARGSHEVRGKREDHFRYALLRDDLK